MQDEQYELHAEIEQRHWWFLGRRRIVRSLLARAVAPSPEACVVDVGCGTGANIASLADDYSCLGIDTSAHAIELARARFPRVQFIQGLMPQDLSAELPHVQGVLLMDVLEHVADDFELFSRIVAKLNPGAQVLVTVPADESLWSPHDVAFGHYRRYDLARLLRVWAGLPITTRMVSYFNARLLPVIRTVRRVTKARNQAAGAAGTDFKIPAAPVNRLLENFFAGERHRLCRAIDNPARIGYRSGASLVALLRREPGSMPVRTKPGDVPADLHDPEARP